MSTRDFFQEIEHTPVSWRKYQLHVPLFYPDIRFMFVSILAPLKTMKALLPSKRLKPYRITPWHTSLTITAYQYRECDLGPYNEISIAVPVTIDEETPVFTGSLRKVPQSPMTYIFHLPVTTEIAREVGAEFAGYPKFMAEIDFEDDGNWLRCELKENNQCIFTISGRKLAGKASPRLRANPITYRNEYLLRSLFILSERETGESKSGEDIKIVLGEHKIAQELRDMKLGKVVSYQYCPYAQCILTPVIESFAG